MKQITEPAPMVTLKAHAGGLALAITPPHRILRTVAHGHAPAAR
jgi:hypothetical protein